MEKGAYIFFNDNDEIDLFIFMKCAIQDLHKALPMNSSNGEILENHDTIHAIFHNGADYLGSSSSDKIPELIQKINAVDLINNSFETLKNYFPALTKKHYKNLINFSKNQLKY